MIKLIGNEYCNRYDRYNEIRSKRFYRIYFIFVNTYILYIYIFVYMYTNKKFETNVYGRIGFERKSFQLHSITCGAEPSTKLR